MGFYDGLIVHLPYVVHAKHNRAVGDKFQLLSVAGLSTRMKAG